MGFQRKLMLLNAGRRPSQPAAPWVPLLSVCRRRHRWMRNGVIKDGGSCDIPLELKK